MNNQNEKLLQYNEKLLQYNEVIHSKDSTGHCNKSLDKSHGFSCPHELPASAEDSFFCTPHECQEKIPTKKFSSPNTNLSPEELEEQKQCIEQINKLLSTLTNPRNPNNLSVLRLHFRTLRGILIEVELDCNDTKESIKGLLKDAGRDFLELEDIGEKYFIPYQRICMLNSNDCSSESHGHMELEDIDECLRRDIVLNFGKVVSSNPNLINIFFGIPLYLQLVQLIGWQVVVRVQGESNVIKGKLVETLKDKICINTLENTIKEIKIVDICSIVLDKM